MSLMIFNLYILQLHYQPSTSLFAKKGKMDMCKIVIATVLISISCIGKSKAGTFVH